MRFSSSVTWSIRHEARRGLSIRDVIHRSFVAIDEAGTAAAAAAVIVGALGIVTDAVALALDRPFFFAIRDDAMGAIRFVGRVVSV